MHVDMTASFPKKVAPTHRLTVPNVATTMSDNRVSSLTERHPRTVLFPFFVKGVPPHWRNPPPSARIFVPLQSCVREMREMRRRVQKALERLNLMMKK